jgi:hypothetical protein
MHIAVIAKDVTNEHETENSRRTGDRRSLQK